MYGGYVRILSYNVFSILSTICIIFVCVLVVIGCCVVPCILGLIERLIASALTNRSQHILIVETSEGHALHPKQLCPHCNQH